MSNKIMQEKDADITELVEEVLFLEDLEMDNDIREWLQTPTVQLQDYGVEAEREEEYFAILNEISDYYLAER
ncbi:hypothetical protein HRF69_13340 [Bacillus circulans]|uniref:hypothetical protein n=1 Tax=Niallia circulans TaxID=1397 RepID=UPI001560A746|nr:hypothetical protein [Niallia circulans]NRG28102.1 hypothetical protein [Niallia circulans]